MKLSFTVLALAFAEETNDNLSDDAWISGGQEVGDNPRLLKSGGDRDVDVKRYDDLTAIAKKMFAKAGHTGKNKFDERKYWTYGCHCLMLGDRPMSDMGRGEPVDELDSRCRFYKECQRCVRDKHGDQCIGEFVKYTWKYSKKLSQFVSKNDAGTCERELFECDLQFAKDTLDNKNVFNEDNHLFWGTGFNSEEKCVPSGNVPNVHECCGGHNTYYTWMGTNNKQCCSSENGKSGYVKKKSESC